jgi:hypothetical protein
VGAAGYPFARGPDAKRDELPVFSPSQHEAFNRDVRAGAHTGNLHQGVTGTFKDVQSFEGSKDCFEAVATFMIDRSGVTLLFPIGIGGELNRFFIERVDADADHSTLYLSRGSCRVAFTISASISREGSWVPLPIGPPKSSKASRDAERN